MPKPKNLTPSQVGQAFITVLEERGITLYGPGMHPGVGYGWGYFGDEPAEENSGYSTLPDMIDAFLLWLEEDDDEPEEEPFPSPMEISSAGFEMVSQGVEIVAAALHFAPNIPIPQELLAATTLESPEDLEDEQLMQSTLHSLITMIEQGILEATPEHDVIVSPVFQEGVARMLMALDMPLVVGQERAERALIILVPALLETFSETELLESIEPHLRHVTSMAQGRRDINAIILSIILAHYLIWAKNPHQAQQTMEQLFAMLDLGILEECSPEEALFVAGEIVGLGDSCLNYEEEEKDAAYLELARTCFERTLDIRQQFLDPFHLEIAETFISLGDVARDQQHLHIALDYYRKAEEVYLQNQETSDEKIISFFETQHAIGMTFLGMKEFAKAENQFHAIIEQITTAPIDPDIADMLRCDAINWLSVIEHQQGNGEKAIQLLRDTLQHYHPTPENRGGVLVQLKLHSTLSMMLIDEGKSEEAGELLRQMLLINEQALGDDRELSEALRIDLESVLDSIDKP